MSQTFISFSLFYILSSRKWHSIAFSLSACGPNDMGSNPLLGRVLLKRSKNFRLSAVRGPPLPFVVRPPPSALRPSDGAPLRAP